jgi:Family of unknown function (DUF6111)
MIRVVIENLLLFLTPAFLYFAYVLIAGRTEQEQHGGRSTDSATDLFDGAPYVWLFFAGTALVLLVLVAFGSNSGGKPGQHYAPPTMKDGRIVPGRME